MQRLGFIHDMMDVKVLILYVMALDPICLQRKKENLKKVLFLILYF